MLRIKNIFLSAIFGTLYINNIWGTEVKEINTTADFLDYLSAVNSGSDLDATLMNDISVEYTSSLFTEEGYWGIGTKQHPYKNTFDGNSHTINFTCSTSGSNWVSLFCSISTAVIKNLNVNANLTDVANSAILVRENTTDSRIENCTTSGSITGKGYVGGICCQTTGTIINCINYAAITSTINAGNSNGAGGISDFSYGTIANCANFGAISSNNGFTGGIVAINSANALNISNCINAGTLAGGTVGGLVGKINNSVTFTSNNAYLNDVTSAVGAGEAPTGTTPLSFSAEEFHSGAATYALNGNASTGDFVWFQNLADATSYPSLSNDSVVYRYTVYDCDSVATNSYSNQEKADTMVCKDIIAVSIARNVGGEGVLTDTVWNINNEYAVNDNSLLLTASTDIKGENVLVRQENGYVCEKFHLHDAMPFYTPEAFTAKTFTYDRPATTSSIYTFILPVDMSAEYVNGKLYMFADFKNDILSFKSLDIDQQYVTANTPYVLKNADSNLPLLSETAKNIEVSNGEPVSIVYNGVSNYGVYESESFQADDFTTYFGFTGGILKKFAKSTLKPFRTILKYEQLLNNTLTSLGVSFDDDVTGVLLVNSDELINGLVNVYDINGRIIRSQVESISCFENLSNGIYIVNGKKYLINHNTIKGERATINQTTNGNAE